MASIVQFTPQNVDYTIWQGDTWQPGTITVTASGTPIDFTGWTATMEIRNAISNDVALTLTSNPAAGIAMSSVGVITLSMTATQTSALIGEYRYDLQTTNTSGAIRTFLYGVINVTSDTTAN